MNNLVHFNRKQILNFLKTNNLNDFYENKDYIEFRHLPDKEAYEECLELITKIYSEPERQSPGYTYITKGLVLRLLMLLDDPTRYQSTYVNLGISTEKDRVDEIKAYIDTAKRRISRDELSSFMHYSTGYLSRLFKKHTGESLMDYAQRIYLNEAINLLINSDLSVSEISRKIGFTNRTQFYRIFEEKYQATPQQYRKKNAKIH